MLRLAGLLLQFGMPTDSLIASNFALATEPSILLLVKVDHLREEWAFKGTHWFRRQTQWVLASQTLRLLFDGLLQNFL